MPSEVVCLSVVHTLLGRVMCKQTCERLSVELRTRETLRVQSLEDSTAIPSKGVVRVSVAPTLLGREMCKQICARLSLLGKVKNQREFESSVS